MVFVVTNCFTSTTNKEFGHKCIYLHSSCANLNSFMVETQHRFVKPEAMFDKVFSSES